MRRGLLEVSDRAGPDAAGAAPGKRPQCGGAPPSHILERNRAAVPLEVFLLLRPQDGVDTRQLQGVVERQAEALKRRDRVRVFRAARLTTA